VGQDCSPSVTAFVRTESIGDRRHDDDQDPFNCVIHLFRALAASWRLCSFRLA
jgi:hypothetical protein